jgi:hypothetical protein
MSCLNLHTSIFLNLSKVSEIKHVDAHLIQKQVKQKIWSHHVLKITLPTFKKNIVHISVFFASGPYNILRIHAIFFYFFLDILKKMLDILSHGGFPIYKINLIFGISLMFLHFLEIMRRLKYFIV